MNQKIIDDYFKAVLDSIKNGGTSRFWPFEPGQVDSYFIDLLSINIFEKFKQDKNKFQEALKTLPPNILRWFLLPFAILGLKLAKKYEGYLIKPEEMIDFIITVREVLKEKVKSDPFCLDGKNIILSEQEISKLLKGVNWFDSQERKIVSFLSTDLESFVWSINFDLFTYNINWNGPYMLSDGKMLLVKEFFDLNSPVWKNDISFDKVKVCFLFKEKVDVLIDFMGHIIYSGKIWDKLDKFAVVVDGEQLLNLDEIQKISNYFSQKREQQLEAVNKFSPEQLIRKGTEVYCYMFHNFFDYYREGYQPPKEFEKRLKQDGLKYWNKYKYQEGANQNMTTKYFKRLYDPRNNYTD